MGFRGSVLSFSSGAGVGVTTDPAPSIRFRNEEADHETVSRITGSRVLLLKVRLVGDVVWQSLPRMWGTVRPGVFGK